MPKKQSNGSEAVKKYSLSDSEKASVKRILTTMGFFNTAVQGLQYSMHIEQAGIEKRVGVSPAPQGFKNETRIDMETMELLVQTVKE